VSCAKTAEPMKMPGMVSWVSPGNMYYIWGVDVPTSWALLGCLADWKAL